MPDVTDVFVQTVQLQRDPGRSGASAASKRTAPQWQPPARRLAGAAVSVLSSDGFSDGLASLLTSSLFDRILSACSYDSMLSSRKLAPPRAARPRARRWAPSPSASSAWRGR